MIEVETISCQSTSLFVRRLHLENKINLYASEDIYLGIHENTFEKFDDGSRDIVAEKFRELVINAKIQRRQTVKCRRQKL